MRPNQNVGFLKVLKNYEFLKLWIGQIISYIGDRLTQMALLGWLIASAKSTGIEMARITFFNLLPAFLFGQMAGALADRWSRKWVMIVSDLLRAALVFAIAFLIFYQSASTTLVYFLVFFSGISTAFFYPAKLSIIPNLVESHELQVANALNSGTGMIATLIGTYFAGLLIDKAGFYAGFMVNGVTYIMSALAILWIHLKTQPSTIISQEKLTFKADFKKVWDYLKTHRRALQLILLSIALSIFSSFFYVSITVLAVDYYKLGTAGVGRLLTMLGVGMIAGSGAAIFLRRWFKITHLLVGSFLIICFTNVTAELVTSFSMAWIWLMLLGAANAVILITVDTLLQKSSPDRFRGKVFGFRSMVTNGFFLLSLLAVGELLKVTSPFLIFKILSGISFVIAIAILVVEQEFFILLLQQTVKIFMKVFFLLEVEGRDFLRFKTKMILAGNHTGFLDSMILIAASKRPVKFLVAQSVFKWPIVGWFVKRAGVIPVVKGKGQEALDFAIEHLNRGKVVGIFPEGRLTPDGNIGAFHRGVVRLHLETQAPIVPFAIQGGFEAWGWGHKLPKPRKIVVQFGQPIVRSRGDEKVLLEDIRCQVQFMKEALERRERAKAEQIYYESVLSLMLMKSDIYGARTALSLKEGNLWKELSYIELSRQARDLSNYLIEKGIQRQDRIAILSESRSEWGIALFAAIRTGAVTVPLDIKLTSSELVSILSNAEPRVLFVSSQFAEVAKNLKMQIPSLQEIILLDEAENIDFPYYKKLRSSKDYEGRERDIDETALIIYTSGTTGNPKGVMTSFRNLVFQVRHFEKIMQLTSRDMFLSILPLNHLLELTGGFLGVLHAGGRICYSQSLHPQEIGKIMKEKKVTFMITVPLFLKMLKGSIEKEVRRSNMSQQHLFQFSFHLARWIPFYFLRRLLFYPVHQQFGGKLRGFIAGGAPLEIEVGGFFNRIGIPVYQGYGLTETSPVITVNTPQFNKLGTVGRPLDGAYVRIMKFEGEEEGEILTKGPHVMKGYYRNEGLTREVIDESKWFHTGDLGRIDQDGFLYITGRIKNLIVLGGGKKVHPEEVEGCLSQSSFFKEVCVLGCKTEEGRKEGTEEVAAVVVPADHLKRDFPDAKVLEKEIESEVKKLSQNLAHYKHPTRILIHYEDLPKTATRKVKRPLILEWIKQQKGRES